jgi:L-lactate dehydrogenase complex protein LldE
MRVALFITCFKDTLFPNVGIAITLLLERLDLTVDFPEAQTCCGQMHFNTGHQREAIPLVRHFIEVFSTAEVIVAPAASCAGQSDHHYPHQTCLRRQRTARLGRPARRRIDYQSACNAPSRRVSVTK